MKYKNTDVEMTRVPDLDKTRLEGRISQLLMPHAVIEAV